ncbi:hypothetical protein A3C26_02130 [Candidatus Daviesbacteria bacterium RIFCSPHIGHO2_02_FULL_39_12]|uniref:Uncharacterized protein n=1 Tax=Candidatus Daviesbacteria bacterium RIFCSPHIGHO2_02_FULL_39_12 TaxID=1797770 RepID=A0A1F5J945_9BACT|nr:MAG: hypothetical protein A3C26_02130 [Candidatus Daviesbacteria bacterium RIFCSPHIGHO2_02_FULL_39_12]
MKGGEKLELLWYFVAGFFLFNSVPHLVKGITGQTHMTPFKRVSSPVLNVVWAFTNIVLGLYVLGAATGSGGLTLPWNADLSGINLWVFLTGGFAVGAYLASFWSNPKARLPWQKD